MDDTAGALLRAEIQGLTEAVGRLAAAVQTAVARREGTPEGQVIDVVMRRSA